MDDDDCVEEVEAITVKGLAILRGKEMIYLLPLFFYNLKQASR